MKYNREDVLRLVLATFFCGIVVGMIIIWLVVKAIESGVL